MKRASSRSKRNKRLGPRGSTQVGWQLTGLALLAMGLLYGYSHGNADAASVQHSPHASKPWLRPFQWKNEVDPTEPKPQPKPEPKQGYGFSGLNFFRWTNEDGSENKKSELPVATNPPKRVPTAPFGITPPDDLSTAIATDGPEQPQSVLSTSLAATANQTNAEKQVAYVPDSIDWPVASDSSEQTTDTSGQGINPFGWSNAGPTTNTQLLPPKSIRLDDAKVAVIEPWKWSNDNRGKEKPQDLIPPKQPSFNDAVYDALSWGEQPDPEEAKMLEKSFPPNDATAEEVVEWEKEAYPWIRPFYWSNEEKNEIAFEDDYEIEDPAVSPGYVPWLARPFTWTDTKKKKAGTAKPMVAPDVSRRTRTVAYQIDGETLPRPLPALDSSESGDSEDLGPGLEENSSDEFNTDEKGAIAEAETLGREPEDNSLQFLRADTVLLKPGEFQFDYGVTYSKFDVTLPVLVNAGPGVVTVEHAELRLREMRVPLEVRYGLARRVQLFLNVPFGWVNSELSFVGFDEFENDGGLGDIVFGGTFLLREGDGEKSDAILTLATVAPTGDDPFTPVGLSPSSPTLGGGTWSLSSNLLLVRNYDPVVLFYGAGTRQHFLSKFEGVNFRPGGEYNYQFGVGFAVNSQVTLSTRFNGAYISELRIDGQRIRGSIQEPMTLGLAMTISKCKKLIEPFVDFGLTDDATDARVGIIWTR